MEKMKPLNGKSPLDAIAKMERLGMRVVEAPDTDVPTAFDYTGFESEVYPNQTAHIADEVRDLAEACKDFLSGSILTDTFATHAERMDWFNSQVAEHGDEFTAVQMKNRLRANNLYGPLNHLKALAEAMRIFKVNTPIADEIRSLYATIPNIDQYDSMSTDEKVRVAQCVSDIARKVLEILSKPAA